MTLPRRECFVKLEGRPPFRARTADVPPAFKSIDFKAEWLPRYLTSAAQRSPYLKPAADVDAEIAARLARINNAGPRPDTDFSTPEPLPLVDAIERARDFLKDQSPNLRVIEGGGGKDDGDISR
jgi:hypothetical protein